MNKNIRWIISIAAAVAAIPAGWSADMLLSGPSQFGALLAATNTLVLLP